MGSSVPEMVLLGGSTAHSFFLDLECFPRGGYPDVRSFRGFTMVE